MMVYLVINDCILKSVVFIFDVTCLFLDLCAEDHTIPNRAFFPNVCIYKGVGITVLFMWFLHF